MNDKSKKIKTTVETGRACPPESEGRRRDLSLNITEADLKLLRLIRSIDSGEIENIKVRKGLPVNYKAAWKKGKF